MQIIKIVHCNQYKVGSKEYQANFKCKVFSLMPDFSLMMPANFVQFVKKSNCRKGHSTREIRLESEIIKELSVILLPSHPIKVGFLAKISIEIYCVTWKQTDCH